MSDNKVRIMDVPGIPGFKDTVMKAIDNGLLDDFNSKEYTVFPGFCDVHVHLREPGFVYKEDMLTGTTAAARGGYTAICPMPNLNPVPDSVEHLKVELAAIREKALINVYPFGAITIGEMGKELADLEGMADSVIGFSDDGRGVQTEEMMRDAMKRVSALNMVISAHCEVEELVNKGYIHQGKYASQHGHRGICSESEFAQVDRDVRLAEEEGAAYHVCHISTKETVDIIRKAKARGVDVTCETAPHYLLMDDNMLKEDGWFKMNPPIRDKADRDALIEGIKDGTIDCIATDHAPHSREEKAKGLEKSAFGIVGLETAFPLLYTELVLKGVISMERLMELLVVNPRDRFDIPMGEDFSVWALDEEYEIDPKEFLSKGRATPFAGWKVKGRCKMTVCNGKIVYKERT